MGAAAKERSTAAEVCVSPWNSTSLKLMRHCSDIEHQESEVYVGQGSFGVVKLKLFRGIKVAFKELQPLTMLKEVEHEARNVGKLCHPFLPYLFGKCTQKQPYKIVIQFHGTHSSHRVLTLTTAIAGKKITSSHAWL